MFIYPLLLSAIVGSSPSQVVPAHADVLAEGTWLREQLGAHTNTQFEVRYVPAVHGGGVWLIRESYAGIPIAGSRFALRIGGSGELRQVVGTMLPARVPVAQVDATAPNIDRWWPTPHGLRPVQIEDSGLRIRAEQGPEAVRRYRDAETGEVLAEESRIDEVAVPLVGWREDPLTTPELVTHQVSIDDQNPLALVNGFVRVVHCEFDPVEEICVPTTFPTAAEPDGFPADPPPLADTEAHSDPEDPWAAVQAMQYAARFQAKLDDWGWDADVWDVVECGEDGVEPDACRLLLFTNVVTAGGPLDGAYYSHNGSIYMGQATVVDTSYDLQVLVHEIGHHVTNGWGRPEPMGDASDPSFYRTDYQAINEGTSDVYARWLGLTDEMFVYTRNVGRLYQGPRTRTVQVPFRCPQNVVGESHMEGRIWAAAIVDLNTALIDAGYADENAFPSLFLGAMAAIRQIPREQEAQFAEAAAIVTDEVGLALGDEARSLAAELFGERGLSACDHIVDLRTEPNFQAPAGAVPAKQIEDARFLIFENYRPWDDPELWTGQPRAPSVHHQITLDADERGLVVRFVPDRWRSRKRDDEPLDQEGLVVAALVRKGPGGLTFHVDPGSGVLSNDSEWVVTSEVDPGGDGTLHRIQIDGLEPGETYSIALVAHSPVESGFRLLADHLRWNTLAVDPATSGDTETESVGEVGTGEDSQTETDGDSDSDGLSQDEGCSCNQTPDTTGGWGLLLGLVGLVGRRCRRRRLRATSR